MATTKKTSPAARVSRKAMRSVLISIRATTRERATFERAAAADGRSLSSWIRHVIERHLETNKAP